MEADIIATIKKTFNFSHSDAIHLFQTLMECMKSKELVSRSTSSSFLQLLFVMIYRLLVWFSPLTFHNHNQMKGRRGQ